MAVPVVTSIAPGNGPPAGGTVVSITGTNLAAATGVSFGATPAAVFASLSATQVVANAPAGTGTVNVTVTTAGGTSATSAADQFLYVAGLFSVAEARAFDKGQISVEDFSDAAITAKEAEVREFLERVCGVNFIPTVHTDEYHNGDWSYSLALDWPLVTSVTAVSLRADTTWTALTAGQLTYLQPSDTGILYREDGVWPAGFRNVKVTYTAGWAAVPLEIKRAALVIAATDLPTSNVPWSADSYEAGGMDVSYAQGDGFNDAWHRVAEVRRAIRLYSLRLPGVA